MTTPTAGGRWAAMAAFTQAALWLVFIIFVAVINPRLGISDPRMLSDPHTLLPTLHETPALIVFPGLDIAVGLSLMVVVMASRNRLGDFAITGVVAAVLFVVLATSRLATLPMLAESYRSDPTPAAASFALADSLHVGLTSAIHVFLGIWLLSTGWFGRGESGGLAKVAAAVAVVAGALNLVSVVLPPAAGANVLLLPVFFVALGVGFLPTAAPSPGRNP